MRITLLFAFLFFSVGMFAQTILSVSPSSAVAGQNLNVTITGSNTHFASGSGTTVYFRIYQGSPSIIHPNNINAVSNTSLVANFTIPANVTSGNYDLYTFNETDYSIYKYTCFEILGPQLFSISPATANAGQQNLAVTITGKRTHFTQGSGCNLDIYLGNQSAIINYAAPQNDTVIYANISIPANVFTGNYNVSYYNSQGQYLALQNGLHIIGIPVPEIISVTPNFAYKGESLDVTITGNNCHFMQGSATQVSFYYAGSSTLNVTNAYATDNNTLHAYVNIPAWANPAFYRLDLYNATDGYFYKNNAFQVKAPSITSISPGTATSGQTLNVTITGDHTHFAQASQSVVRFYFQSGTSTFANSVSVVNNTTLTVNVTVPANTYSGNYELNVYNNIDNSMYFNGIHVDGPPTPVIAAITPNHAMPGETLNVTITGTNTHFSSGSATLYFFGSASSTITINSMQVIDAQTINTNISVSSNASFEYFDFMVYNTTDGYLLLNDGFKIGGSISSIAPTTAQPGTTIDVTVSASNCHFTQTTNTVYFTNINTNLHLYPNSITVVNNSTLILNITFPGGKSIDKYGLIVYNSIDGFIYLPNMFLTVGSTGNEIVDSEKTDFMVYPNPVRNELNLTFKSEAKDLNVAIYDIQGKKVISWNEENTYSGQQIFTYKLDKYNLNNGIYFVKITGNSTSEYLKFIYSK